MWKMDEGGLWGVQREACYDCGLTGIRNEFLNSKTGRALYADEE
jgi:hypothetical protein